MSETGKSHQSGRDYDTRARPIDLTNLRQIAKLCARGLTQAEACRRLGIEPRRFENWKYHHKNSDKFAAELEKFRAERFDSLIEKIEKAADGVGMKQPDWRSAQFLLSVGDRSRFSTHQPEPPSVTINNNFNMEVLTQIAAKVYGDKATALPGPASVASLSLPDNAGVQRLLQNGPLNIDADGNPKP